MEKLLYSLHLARKYVGSHVTTSTLVRNDLYSKFLTSVIFSTKYELKSAFLIRANRKDRQAMSPSRLTCLYRLRGRLFRTQAKSYFAVFKHLKLVSCWCVSGHQSQGSQQSGCKIKCCHLFRSLKCVYINNKLSLTTD